MREYSGLSKLKSVGGDEVYCPKCGNYLEVVLNGWFHGQLFYCPKEKKVFAVTIKDITKNAGKEYIESCEEDIKIGAIRRKITKENYKNYLDLIK